MYKANLSLRTARKVLSQFITQAFNGRSLYKGTKA